MAGSTTVPGSQNLQKLLQFLEQSSTFFNNDPKRNHECRSSTNHFNKPEQVAIEKWRHYKKENVTGTPESNGLLLSSEHGPLQHVRSFVGGMPITLELAMKLRQITYGSCHHSFSTDWRKSSLSFHHLDSKFPYGILGHRCGSRGLILCVQAYLLKHLIFDRDYKSSLFAQNVFQPTEYERRRAFVNAVAEMLWQAGDRQRCRVCLLQDEKCFGSDYRYRNDHISEKLHIFEFTSIEDLKTFIKRNLDQFQSENSCGCILFLYSIVLSRTISKICQDVDVDENCGSFKLLTDMEQCTQELINLLLTGQAVAHLHNGDMVYDNDGNLLSKPVSGIKNRSDIGFLFWDKSESDDNRTEVGSMLKTPQYPIWLTKVNSQFGLLFSTNVDLVRHWRVEHRFQLNYYTGLSSQTKPTVLSIDTRFTRVRPKTSLFCRTESQKIPPLEQCIMTKWSGASVHWNGTSPYV